MTTGSEYSYLCLPEEIIETIIEFAYSLSDQTDPPIALGLLMCVSKRMRELAYRAYHRALYHYQMWLRTSQTSWLPKKIDSRNEFTLTILCGVFLRAVWDPYLFDWVLEWGNNKFCLNRDKPLTLERLKNGLGSLLFLDFIYVQMTSRPYRWYSGPSLNSCGGSRYYLSITDKSLTKPNVIDVFIDVSDMKIKVD
eukprot:TRINITY_DN2635_c0_g1_i1.p1 TRINITY_DN2635_c0_g1~~TRINITY_DN2635_c0_g1_i1.p1  ORF type:complete len:195 (+),score=18.93 TRINITY_DN2635_c0_g1_i1:77-661(+)